MTDSRNAARIVAAIEESIAVKQAVLDRLVAEIETAAAWIVESLGSGGKLLLFGNGGSAADCQHLAAELVGRFERDGAALAAIALTTDSSTLTAIANDSGLDRIFARQIAALGRPDDIALALSTMGNSPNVVAGLEAAHEAGLKTVALTGRDGGRAGSLCNLEIRVPSDRTARIQEAHTTIGHAICEVVEAELRP